MNKFHIFSILFVLVGICQGQEIGIMPVHPEKLLELLPSKRDGWKLTKSKGWMDEGAALESQGEREFVSETPTKTAESNEKPMVTSVAILDTAKAKGSDRDLFANFQPVTSERYEKKRQFGHKTIILRSRRGKTVAKFLLKDRWVLTITTEHQDEDAIKEWYSGVNLAGLSALGDSKKHQIPEEIESVMIDELDPSSNTSFVSAKGVDESPEVESDQEEGE